MKNTIITIIACSIIVAGYAIAREVDLTKDATGTKVVTADLVETPKEKLKPFEVTEVEKASREKQEDKFEYAFILKSVGEGESDYEVKESEEKIIVYKQRWNNCMYLKTAEECYVEISKSINNEKLMIKESREQEMLELKRQAEMTDQWDEFDPNNLTIN